MVKKEELYAIIEDQKKQIAALQACNIDLNKKQEKDINEAVHAEREHIYQEWKKNQGMFMERYIREIISDELDMNINDHIADYLRDNLSINCSDAGDYYSRWGNIELSLGKEVISSDSINLGR